MQNDLNPRVVVSFFPSSGNLFHKEVARNENLRFPALVLALGRNRLLFSTALVEWWCVGFSMRVLRQGGLILWKQLKVCRRMHGGWYRSKANGLSLNAEKCKELRIDFKKIKQPFDPVLVGGEALPIVESVKILGLVMTGTLQWKDNIRESIKKANKRLYFIVLLKRAGVNVNDVLNFYCTVIRPVLEYCAQAFHHSIPKYLADELETVQKRVLKILSPVMTYCEALEYYRLPILYFKEERTCVTNSLRVSSRIQCINFIICCRRRMRLIILSGRIGILICTLHARTVFITLSSLLCVGSL